MSSPRRSKLLINDENDDENDDEGWLYRRMLSDSQHVRRLQKMMSADNKHKSILDQALQDLELPQDLFHGIKVWKITTTKSSFVPRYVTIDKTRQFICLTHQFLTKKILSADRYYTRLSKGRFWKPKKEAKQYFDVADIDSWHVGVVATQRAELARQLESSSKEEQSFNEMAAQKLLTIYYKGGETLDLIVPKSRQLNHIILALNELYAAYHQVQPWLSRDALFLRYISHDVDFGTNNLISQSEFEAICCRINFRVTNAKQAFIDYTSKHSLTYHECTDVLQSLKPKSPALELWNYLFGKEDREITFKELHQKFLLEIQSESDTTLRHAQALLAFINAIELEQHENHQPQDDKFKANVQKHRFHAFLHSELNDAYDPDMQIYDQVLDRPISEYWINTSHNTYLTGDQLRSKSSVEGCMNALLRGCKCLELDCWDGPVAHGKHIPVISHGHTLTSNIEFRHVCQVVRAYLKLYPDSYPIILSLENHCTGLYQRAMVEIMKEVFGKKVFFPSSKHTSGATTLPSPESLRGKVVIKRKRPPEPDSDDEEEKNDARLSKQPIKSSRSGRKNNTDSHSVVAGLAAVTLLHGSKFKSFDESVDQPLSQMHSIGESKLLKILRKEGHGKRFREYNQSHMTRTYPGGRRVDSSNYNPVQAWSLGCQLVALNFQYGDTPILLNDGLFRQGNGCGYVLKPKSILGKEQPHPSAVFVRILSGSCLPKPSGAEIGERIHPFVSVTLHDVRCTADGSEEFYTDTHTTEVVDGNGYSPIWRDEGKKFSVQQLDVAMLLFKVIDKDLAVDDPIVSAAIPVSCLRKGYRSIQLYDNKNHRSGAFRYATLLAHIEY
jgi:phosphatidylinositol phospholipase C delta